VIAVIIPGSGEEHRDVCDIVLWRRGGGLKRINELSPLHQSLHFVLLFPTRQFGKLEITLGGQNDAPDEDNDAQLLEPGEEPPPEGEVVAVRKKCEYIPQIEYFAHRLHPCHDESNHIFKAGCLFQEYIVDSWAAAEQSCLIWLRNNQKTLYSDVHKGLVDAVAANPDAEAQNLGQRTILLSTFSGSSRNMIQHCQDALAINRHFKGADPFMTVTADPNWSEIQAELLLGQTAADRCKGNLTILRRIFHLDLAKANHVNVTR
jgi:hypothetical protein